MEDPYDLVRITPYDFKMYKKDAPNSKIGVILSLVFNELPIKLKPHTEFITHHLRPIRGFEDKDVKGYEIVIEGSAEIDKFVKRYVSFFLLMKKEKANKTSKRRS